MAGEYTINQNEKLTTRLVHFIQEIWPSVYRTINGLFFGLISFIKDTISGLWRKY